TAWSSIASASSFLSLAFSCSSCFSRLASDTLMPPNFAFQAYKVGCDMPCLRHTSGTFIPASCSRRAPMIWSSVNRLRFIHPPPPRGRGLYFNLEDFSGLRSLTFELRRDQAAMNHPSTSTRERHILPLRQQLCCDIGC